MALLGNLFGTVAGTILDAIQKEEETKKENQSSGNTSATTNTTNTTNTTGNSGGSSSSASPSKSMSAVDPFITQYRDALERQRDLSLQNLGNTRRNDFAQIMGNANSAGMMYSNFPERTKIQYDTSTYMPNQTKIQSTYQTGLDKLRTNVISLSNQLKNINDAISDLNKTGVNGNNTNTNGVQQITIDGTTYNIKGNGRKTSDGRYEYDLEDGSGILSIDPSAIKSAN